jgi:hypothetical protein
VATRNFPPTRCILDDRRGGDVKVASCYPAKADKEPNRKLAGFYSWSIPDIVGISEMKKCRLKYVM